MKVVENKKLDCRVLEPETTLEAIEQLQDSLVADLWHSMKSREEDMLKYIRDNFNKCKKAIKKMDEKKEKMTIHIVSGAKYEAGGSGHRPAHLYRAFRRLGYKVRYYYLLECMGMRATKEDLVIVEFPYDKLVQNYNVLTNGAKVIYEVLDDWIALKSSIYNRDVENDLISKVDVVTAVSKKLVEKYLAKYSPNAVDLNLYTTPPKKKIQSKKLIIGYIGFMKGWWFDWHLISQLAKMEDVEIHLVGSSNRFPNQIEKNIFMHDLIGYEHMPDYISSFDVCLIPFKKGDLYDATSPLKLYEYVAGGKPVVAVDSKERMELTQVYFEKSSDDFIKRVSMYRDMKVDGSLSALKDPLFKNESFLEKNSWEVRAKELMRWVER